MRSRLFPHLTLLAVVALGAALEAEAAGRLPIRVETGVRVRMRDGVSLVADVYRPDAEGRFPTLLQRTPYDRKGDTAQAVDLAASGYVVVLQDTRGRYESEGEFYPFRNEASDGYDSVEWVAGQPWSDGKVGMYGGSYVGATQLLAATAKPPHLLAIFPYVTAAEYYEGWTYQGGALMDWFTSSWSSGLAVDTLRRKASPGAHPLEWVKEGAKLSVKQAPSKFGKVQFELQRSGTTLVFDYNLTPEPGQASAEEVRLHVPPVKEKITSVRINGKGRALSPGESVIRLA